MLTIHIFSIFIYFLQHCNENISHPLKTFNYPGYGLRSFLKFYFLFVTFFFFKKDVDIL